MQTSLTLLAIKSKHGRKLLLNVRGTAWCETNIVIGLIQKWIL